MFLRMYSAQHPGFGVNVRHWRMQGFNEGFRQLELSLHLWRRGFHWALVWGRRAGAA
jgi:hypothetical protein